MENYENHYIFPENTGRNRKSTNIVLAIGKNMWKWTNATKLRKALSLILITLIVITSIRYIFLPAKEVSADSTFLLDEGYGASTSVHDSNGNVTSGSITGAIWRTEDLCRDGKCLFFDDDQDFVSFTDDADLDFAASDSFTLMAWFRHAPSTARDVLIAKLESTGTDGGYRLQVEADGTINCEVEDDDADTNTDDQALTTEDYDDNVWHHVACVKSGTSSLTIYVDGTQQAQNSSLTHSTTLANNDTFYIGINGDGTTLDYNGFIDSVKVYRSARTASEIKADYQGVTPSRGESASFGPDQSWISSGLAGYWKLDETSGTATDASGNGLTLTNGGTTTFVSGKFGNGSEHVPASLQHFSTATAINNVQSVSFWTNPDATTNYYISLTSSAYITSSSGTLSATGFTNPKIFVNGIESSTIVADTWQLVTVTTDSPITANQFYIGRQGSNYYDGTIDEVRLYTRFISNTEASQIYSWSAGPVGHWKMDEGAANSCSTDDSCDTSTNEFNGAWNGDTSPAPGKFGNATLYDGSGDNTQVTNNSALQLTVFTVSGWFKINDTPAGGSFSAIINKQAADTNRNFTVFINSAGNLSASTSFSGVDQSLSSATNVDDGLWHYVTYVVDVNKTQYIYMDGILKASQTNTGTVDTQINDLRFGTNNSATNDLDGLIDDVKIYNYARTGSQIVEDMNAGHPAPGSPVGSAASYWKFDEGYGIVAFDDSINGNNLTLSSSSWTANGKFGKAWNGADNLRLSIADDQDLNPLSSEDLSISAWFKSDGTTAAATEYLVSKMNASAGYQIYFNTSEQITCGIDDDAISFPEDSATTTSAVYDGNWHHAVCVRDIGQDKLYLYIDGLLAAQDTDLSATGSLLNTATFFIGDQNATNGTDEFLGDVDEVKFYRFALTPEQIKSEYNWGANTVLGTTSTDSTGRGTWSSQNENCPPGQGTTCTAPIGEWKFDENTGTASTFDTSENDNTGTLDSFDSGEWIPSKYGSALNFDSTDNRVSLGSPATLDDIPAGGGFSISAWIYPRSSGEGGAGRIAQKDDGNVGPQIGWQFNLDSSDRLNFRAGFAGSSVDMRVTTTDTVTLNTWQHVAVTWNGSPTASTLNIYINGVEAAYTTQTNGTGSYRSDVANNFYIGNGITQASTFDGYIDEFRFYNYERSQAQVAWDHSRGGPIGWWKFDENTGLAPATLNDSSGRGVNGTAGGTMVSGDWVTGKYNTALNFDGTDDTIDMNDVAAYDFLDGHSFTLEAWVNRDTFAADHTIIAKKNDQLNSTAGFVAWIDDATDDVRLVVSDGDSANLHTVDSSTTLTSTGWNHIVIVYNDSGATSSKIYINGRDDNATNTTSGTFSSIGSLANAVDFRIATESDGGAAMDGKIDDVKIYNFAVTDKQAQAMFNEAASTRFGPQ